jgi:hypothetical protein
MRGDVITLVSRLQIQTADEPVAQLDFDQASG